MQRDRIFIVAILFCSLCLAVSGQVERPRGPVRIPRPVIVAQPANNNVVIYSKKNFAGQSMVLPTGDNRLTDLKPASIRVPAGTVAYLYQYVDSGGGYGILVDLMEDHADLAEFGLSGNVSLITVFPSTRQGLVWARNRITNGQFVPGHWERSRAGGGGPVNTVAVASPPMPGHAPTAPTAIQQQGTRWTITTLGPQSSGDAARWNSADATMGVIGSDFRGSHEIGSAAIERASNNTFIPDWLNFWYPNKQRNDHRSVVYFKRTLTGVIADKITKNWSFKVVEQGIVRTISGTYELSDAPHVSNITGTYQDFDLNVDVQPFADYQYLIRDSHAPERSLEKRMKDLVDSDHDPCTDPFFVVEGEIDSSDVMKQKLATSLHDRIGKQVALYGPWIYDIGHCDHPEIHPAEQIWWTDYVANKASVYHLNVLADSSKRFIWRSQMDDGTKLHPWAAPPITGVFALAFEVPMSTTTANMTTQRFEVANVDFFNVKSISSVDRVYDLVYQGRPLVSFVPKGDVFNVSYENVGLKPGTTNIVRGFLVIETTVGSVKQIATRGVYLSGTQPVTVNVPQGSDPDKVDQRIEQQIFQKTPGHYAFTITRRDAAAATPVREQ